MSITLHTDASRTLYDDSYKAAYASMGPDVRPYVTLRQHTGLEDFYFRTMGRMVATDRGAMQSQVPTTDVDHAKVRCVLSNLIASTITDIFAQDYTNAPQEVPALAKVHAGSIKRQETQKIIDALNAARVAGLPTGHSQTEGGSVGLTAGKLLIARKALKANDIGETPTILIGETQEYDLLAASDNKFTSADFSAASGATTGNIRQGHFGFNYLMIGTGRDEDGLPLVDTDDRVCFAFVPSAVGLVTALEKREVNYESNIVSWRSTAMLRCGAAIIDTKGVTSIECDE
jgi:hypothetical protein